MQAEKSLVKLHDRSMPPPPPPKYPPGAKPPGLKLPASMGPPPPRQKHTNPFLAAPLWEEAARTAPAPESALQNSSNFPEQGAQFGDEEEEEDEAGPMEGVTEAVPDAAGHLAALCLHVSAFLCVDTAELWSQSDGSTTSFWLSTPFTAP